MTRKQKRTLLRVLLAAALTVPALLIPMAEPLRFALLLLPYLTVGWDVLYKAARGIRSGQVFDENFLMAVATLGALALGQAAESVSVMLFYQLGEWFQSVAVGKSRKSIAALLDIRPDTANVENTDGSLRQTEAEAVAVGTVIAVQPGERIPIDGVALSGETALDTAALTGESVPKTVHPGDAVYSGCINLTGLLRLRTTKAFGESTASKILELVENASARKSKSERFLSKFAAVYTPAVCGAALLLALVPPVVRLLSGQAALWGDWVYRALTFLVISCPCALVISIPLTFFAGLGGAGRAGILIKGSNYIEALSKVRTVVFDKTGTLTEGVFAVTEVHAETCTEQALLRLAAAAERYSNHPISHSLQAACDASNAVVENAQEHSGRGVTANVDGVTVAAGNAALMQTLGIGFTPCEKPGTVVYVAREGQFLGWVRISDRVKAASAEAMRALTRAGVRRTVLLTGDERRTAEAVARELGIDTVYAELLPADKLEKVEALLQNADGTLAFVGDGMNDAPVLARADVGIAMGALGSDAAIEAADAVLMDDDPRKAAKAITLSKKCMRIVYENLVFSLGVKLLCLLLGALGLTGMWAAIFADVGVMVLAVLNAVRALRV